MDNPETLATPGTQDTGRKINVRETEGTIKNGQSRDTGNAGYTRHRTSVSLTFIFVLCLVYPVLPVSLDCPFLISPSIFSNVYFRPVSCVPGVTSVSGLSILDCPFGFSNVYFRPVSCRIPKGQSRMDNPETLVTPGTQDTGRK
jgi:hypothetical protein